MKIKTKEEAARVLANVVKLQEKADNLKAEHGIKELEAAASTLKKEVTEFCIAKKIDRLDLAGNKFYGRMIQSVQQRIWVTTKDDIPEGVKCKPLKSLVPKEVFMAITKRVADPDKIQDAIDDGLVTLDEIKPAYVEKMRAPYINVYEAGEKNGEA
jgi:hypothetical protein